MANHTVNRREFISTSAAAAGALLIEGHGLAEGESDVHLCPRSKPPVKAIFATRLDDLTSYSQDWRLTLSCLQGIVNRSQPRLYLIHDRYDELWLNWLQERGDVEKVQWLEVASVFERFLPEVSRMFVTDPAIPATINVATMLAGVHDGLVITPASIPEFDLAMGSYPDSRSDGLDLREMRWKKDVDAYRWAFQHLGNDLSRQAIAILDPQDTAARDYLVEFKIPTLWISGPDDIGSNPQAAPEEEKQFAREIMMKWPPNISCLGWPGTSFPHTPGIGETDGVDLASECAKFWVCTSYDGYSPTVGNISVHSGTTATLRPPAAQPIKLQQDKAYFACMRSDGDGMNFIRHYYRLLYDQPAHGDVPIGWQLGPMASDLIPDIVDYYYKRARPGDCFVNALTGCGYIHEDRYAQNFPAEVREKILRDYVNLSGVYRQRTGVVATSTFAEMPKDLLALFAGIPGMKGVFANYGRTHNTTLENVVTEIGGVPVFRAVNWDSAPVGYLSYTPHARNEIVRFVIDDVKRWTPPQRPTFLHVFLADWLRDLEMATQIAQGLGPGYVAVRPDQLLDLYRQSRAA